MNLLIPDWNQARPTTNDVLKMCRRIEMRPTPFPTEPFDKLLVRVRQTHNNGGAYLGAFEVGPDTVFDWFASRNRLWDERLLDWLVVHPTIVQAFPELRIPDLPKEGNGFRMFDQFLFDGTLANILYNGGAYSHASGNGREEKELALEICDAMFGLRFAEITCNTNCDAWTPWFKGVAWDLTAVIFDRRCRKLWMFAVTDTD